MSGVVRYELKRADGRVVEWPGEDGEDASRRYVDAMRVAGKPDGGGIVAWREPRHGVYVLGRGARIEEA